MTDKPILVVGAGPVGLTAALGLHFYGLPFELFEEDADLSSLWDARLEPHALAYALIAQTARSCFVKVPPRVVASTYKAIGIGEPPDARELREATDFIREKEDLTIRLTLEYGRMKPRLKRFDRPPLPV